MSATFAQIVLRKGNLRIKTLANIVKLWYYSNCCWSEQYHNAFEAPWSSG